MSKVIATATMSLDGKVAYPDDTVGPLFDWYGSGDVRVAPGDPDRSFTTTRASAEYLQSWWPTIGVSIVGRTLFDLTNGWDGRPPGGEDRVLVVTHEPPTDWAHHDSFEFVDGVGTAVERARALAGTKDITITGGDLTGQALELGLVDELRVELVPVIVGAGKDFFGGYSGESILFGNPEVVQGDRVVHLRYVR